MSGPDAILIIQKLGLSQRQFALLTGMHVESITKWARGTPPSALAATFLRLLERQPENVDVLRAIAGVGPGERVKT